MDADPQRPPVEKAHARGYAVVGIASSAGGLKALTQILSDLDDAFPIPVLVVQHLDRTHRSVMAEILTKRTGLSVKQAENGELCEAGFVYIAPPDHHMLVNSDLTLTLSQTELVHFVRPSADTLFESIAKNFGERAIAVVATGTGTDGATGVRAIGQRGGTVLAQDEASSDFFGMPGAAIGTGGVDMVLPLGAIGAALNALAFGTGRL